MRKLRIFVVSPWSMLAYQKKQKGFSDTSEHRVLRGFVKSGHEVHLLIPREFGIPKDFSFSGIFIHEFKMSYIPQGKDRLSRLMQAVSCYFQYFLFIFLSIKRFMHVMKIYGKPDVIYGFAREGCISAYIMSKLSKVSNISRLYGTTLYEYYLPRPLRFFLPYCCFELFAFKLPCKYLIITNDGTRGDEAARKLKVPFRRVKHWMNGVDFPENANVDFGKLREELGIDPQAHVIVSISRLTWWKRVDRLIRALPSIASVDKHVKVLIIGEGEERENLERLSETLGVKRIVDFLGAVPHKDVEKYLCVADLFVSLYDFSNLSSSLLEAMASGVCIVALNSGTTRSVITNGKNGILINYQDLEKLPTIICRLFGDENLRRKLGTNARQYALKDFKSWDERVAMEVQLIEHLFE